jgi:hypothetical protein
MRPRQFQAQLTRYFAGRRRQAYDELIAALDGDRYLALLTAIDALLTDPPFTAEADKPARRRLIPVLRRVYRHVDQNLTTAAHLPHGDDRNTALHEARKAAKRLRYATEAAAPALGKPARRLTDRVKQLQELLRQHQDATVSLDVLRELGADAHLEGGNGFTFGLLYHQAVAADPDAETRPGHQKPAYGHQGPCLTGGVGSGRRPQLKATGWSRRPLGCHYGWYNPRRLPAGLGGLSPDEYEDQYHRQQQNPDRKLALRESGGSGRVLAPGRSG